MVRRAAVADAELVAFGIGHEDPIGAVLVDLAGPDAASAEGFEAAPESPFDGSGSMTISEWNCRMVLVNLVFFGLAG